MKITLLLAHLEQKSMYRAGDNILPGYHLGRMGSTGASTAAHVHMGNAIGYRGLWRLRDVEEGDMKDCPRELNRFISEKFLKGIKVTTPYCDYQYQKEYGKVHYGYDVSTRKRYPWNIYWPIDEHGSVLAIGWDDAYGNYILIGYEV